MKRVEIAERRRGAEEERKGWGCAVNTHRHVHEGLFTESRIICLASTI